MRIDSSTYHQLPATKWTERKSFKDTNETFYLDINSNGHDIIEVSEYEVIESTPPIQMEKNDSGQELELRSRGLTYKEKMIRKWVTNIYKYYAYISFTNNRSRIDIHI
ncbi:MAG: hypothetical protein PVG86_00630 [Desulfobacterales bacterium]